LLMNVKSFLEPRFPGEVKMSTGYFINRITGRHIIVCCILFTMRYGQKKTSDFSEVLVLFPIEELLLDSTTSDTNVVYGYVPWEND